MLQTICIGHIGADAEVKTEQGREFTTFRIAHTDRWKDAAGTAHEETTWVDCIINGKPKVVDFLKRGTQVFVMGTTRLRVYSSKKDRCMKAGLTIQVRTIELIGGKVDAVPSVLYDEKGAAVNVGKYYYAADRPKIAEYLVSRSGDHFVKNADGWVQAAVENSEAAAAGTTEPATEQQEDDLPWNDDNED